MEVNYIQHWGDDLIVVNAARVSLDNVSEWEWETQDDPIGLDFAGNHFIIQVPVLSNKDAKLVNYLAVNRHTSCFEHMGATLKLKVPIFIARQIQRHRTFSYNEISRRYVDNPPEFFWPESWRGRPANVKQGSSDEVITELAAYPNYDDPLAQRPVPMQNVQLCIENAARQWYNQMLEAGVAPELARMILPQNMYTEFYMSGNLRAWAHFLSLRLDAHAQVEVQNIAQQCADILTPLFPVSMKALMEN